MASMQIRNVLEHAENVRRFVRDYAERHRRHAKNDYLEGIFKEVSEHEERVRRCLAEFTEEADDRLLDTWLQYPGIEELENAMDNLAAVNCQDDDIVLQSVVLANEALVHLYDQATAQVKAPALNEFLGRLREIQEHHLRQIANSVTEFEQS